MTVSDGPGVHLSQMVPHERRGMMRGACGAEAGGRGYARCGRAAGLHCDAVQAVIPDKRLVFRNNEALRSFLSGALGCLVSV